MSMYDMITIGSSLIDIFIESDEFLLKPESAGVLLCQKYGDKVELGSLKVLTGGGGSNTAVGFSRAGLMTAVISETGQDILAQLILDDFHKERVSTNLIIQEKKEVTGGSVILIGQDGGRTAMVHRGAASMLDPHDIPIKTVESTDWIHLSSIGGNIDTLRTIFDTRKAGRLSWNPGKSELLLLAEEQLRVDQFNVEILFLNVDEWQMVNALQTVLLEKIPIVVVTAGAEGGEVFYRRQKLSYMGGKTRSFDDTGAGDSFVTGFVTAYLRQKQIEECIEVATRSAESVIQQVGAKAGLLRKRELFLS